MKQVDTLDSKELRNALGHYPTGVAIVTSSTEDDQQLAMVVGSFTSVSLNPPLVGFFPGRDSKTWPLIRARGRFCVNVSTYKQAELCGRMGGSRDDRFAGLDWMPSPLGSPMIAGAVAYYDCEIESVTEAGDHDFVLGRLRYLSVGEAEGALVFERGAFGRMSVV